MNYIVLDLEWNQPFSVKSMIKKPVPLRGEIIEIGAVRLDEDFHITSTFGIIVTPEFYTTMHKKVTKITGIKTKDLQYGFPLEFAVKHFRKWCGEDFAFITWGTDDIGMLKDNMAVHNIDAEWLPCAYNLQLIFDNQISHENRQISLKDALERVGESGREAHDALNDAYNTAIVCPYLDMEKGLKEYDILEEKCRNFSGSIYDSRIEGEFESPIDAAKSAGATEICCPVCGEAIEIGKIERQNQTKFICLGKCRNGEEFFLRVRARKRINDKYTMNCIIYEADDENREYYRSVASSNLEKKQRWLEYTQKVV